MTVPEKADPRKEEDMYIDEYHTWKALNIIVNRNGMADMFRGEEGRTTYAATRD